MLIIWPWENAVIFGIAIASYSRAAFSRFAFIRTAGIIQSLLSISISAHSALVASIGRHMVSNSNKTQHFVVYCILQFCKTVKKCGNSSGISASRCVDFGASKALFFTLSAGLYSHIPRLMPKSKTCPRARFVRCNYLLVLPLSELYCLILR